MATPTFRPIFLLFAAVLCGVASADEALLRVRQATVPNPVADPVALAHRLALTPAPANGALAALPGAIEIRHTASGIGWVWDPVECRLLYAWKGESAEAGQLLIVAEGPAPLAATVGVFGEPQYFGYRIVDGVPEFLFRLGRLAVEERIEIAPDGSALTQRWKVFQVEHDVMLAVPARWKNAVVRPKEGSWVGDFLKIPKAKAAEISLTWQLGKVPELPALTGTWMKPVTAKVAP